ncbi:IS1634 family transposase (plasmid) [Bradyrhizobium sp. 186]|uniref:IS1634 family transposase n=1 Tax=Bradyrhizobium sp. 186 TaxID=2782654 RepID=UPI00200128E3|nr:IS1634 family transposase [Bradyrhizobium sp. 186]UPK32159.1 IS1634 family transposase [Bradyrhizobium sp. 186]UPK32463.1 IS1634 family transposase [Bradyrhizobium sp. 186]UPK32617.1 IS1634 family transposase [Bradyrhizobium sp. 186]UPK32698.1 IS1634 family transposase [Bradyrhizobium sp. 186]UPK32788.1 IS1634 family transposase [Bradyrhizobium sp. 186]
MFVARIPNRNSPPAILLRESYREGDKIKSRTLANLSHWPDEKIDALRRVLKGEELVSPAEQLRIERSLPHGHVAAVLGMARQLGLHRLVPDKPRRLARLALALIVARVIEPAAKLATARQLSEATAAHSLGELLDLSAVDEDELYEALDLLGTAQPGIEATLAKRHLHDGSLVLYDLTSSYLEGRHCELARHGYSRDGRSDKLQIVFGLLCAADGCPVAVEVFEGNTADPSTLAAQVDKLKARFKLSRVVLVGDRGMITSARIEADLMPAGLDWITALRAPAIRKLAEDGGPLQLSLFDDRDMAEITSPDFPGERLIVCRNPDLADERRRKRGELLAATEKDLARVKAAVQRQRNPLRGEDEIGLKVGAVLGKRKMAKHFHLAITDTSFDFSRIEDAIANEASLDGFYVLRTNVPAENLDTAATVRAYKSLAQVERAFRTIKTVELEVRPIHHRLAGRVRAHVFLCMLAYYIVWHMRRALAPILFDDHDREAADAARVSPVAKARVSAAARTKANRKHTHDGRPVHSFRTLLQDLATLTRNIVRIGQDAPAAMLTSPTPLQQDVFNRLGIPIAP